MARRETEPSLHPGAETLPEIARREEAERRLQLAEAELRQATERHEQTRQQLLEIEEQRERMLGASELTRRAIADVEQKMEQLQQELADIQLLEGARDALALAVQERDDTIARAAAGFEAAVTLLADVEAKRDEVAEAHERLRDLDPSVGRVAPDEPDILHEPWQQLVAAVKAELDEKLESDIVEAAARSHLPSAINALPQHLRILAQQRRNELQREQLHRFRGS